MKTTLRHLFCAIGLIAQAAPATAQDKLTLVLDRGINFSHATLLIAREKNFFRDARLEVELIEPAGPDDSTRRVAAGQADLGICSQPQLHLAVPEGLALARIATLVATPLASLAVLAEGPVKSIADLKGRKVGMAFGGFEETMLSTMLRRNGLRPEDIEVVPAEAGLVAALLAQKADAVIGALRAIDLSRLAAAGKPAIAFAVEEHGIPVYDELIVVAHRTNLRDGKLRRFVDALERGVQFLVNHPDEGWDALLKARKEFTDEGGRRAFDETLSRLARRPGALDRARYTRFARFIRDNIVMAQRELPPMTSYAVELDIP